MRPTARRYCTFAALVLTNCSTQEDQLAPHKAELTDAGKSSTAKTAASDSGSLALDKTRIQTDSGTIQMADSKPKLPEGFTLEKASGRLRVEIGSPDEAELEFVATAPGGPIAIAGLGQVGLTARLAIRVQSEDADIETATIEVVLINLDGVEREPGINNNATLPQQLQCRSDGWCYPVIQRVEISHLNRLPALEGSVISIDVRVQGELANEPSGTAHSWGYFENRN